MTETQDRVVAWFRAKRRELLAGGDLAQDHGGLIGSHREAMVRDFLRNFLPGRMSVDRGVVYSALGRSGECDAVIWDSANFPRLAMIDHASFFVESVAVVVEVKSNYSRRELDACKAACSHLRRLSLGASSGRHLVQVQNRLEIFESRLASLEAGQSWGGTHWASPRVGYGVVFLHGGQDVRLSDIAGADDPDLDELPNFVAFLEAGHFVRRWEPDWMEWQSGETPHMTRTVCEEDALVMVADELLRLIRVITPGFDGMWDLGSYKSFFEHPAEETMELAFTRFPHGFHH